MNQNRRTTAQVQCLPYALSSKGSLHLPLLLWSSASVIASTFAIGRPSNGGPFHPLHQGFDPGPGKSEATQSSPRYICCEIIKATLTRRLCLEASFESLLFVAAKTHLRCAVQWRTRRTTSAWNTSHPSTMQIRYECVDFQN